MNLRLLKPAIITALVISFPVLSYAGLSGTYTVGATGYDYTNLAAVAAALNGNTLTGDVILNCDPIMLSRHHHLSFSPPDE